jgi:cation-transporting ATPase 13A3/4/5
LDVSELRIQVEKELIFLGLLLLENKLKIETEPTLDKLRRACVRSVMVTGDNPLTAVTVAKECKLVEPGARLFLSHVETTKVNTKQISISIPIIFCKHIKFVFYFVCRVVL